MSEENAPNEVKKESEPKHESSKIVKIKKERVKGEKKQYSVIFEGSDSKKGMWIDANLVNDQKLIDEFVEKKLKKEKKEKEKEAKKQKQLAENDGEKKEEHENKSEDSKKKESKPKKPKAKGSNLEKIYGITSKTDTEMIFAIKEKDSSLTHVSFKELKEKYPNELCDFLIKHIVIE